MYHLSQLNSVEQLSRSSVASPSDSFPYLIHCHTSSVCHSIGARPEPPWGGVHVACVVTDCARDLEEEGGF